MKRLLVVLHLLVVISCGSNKDEVFILPGVTVQLTDKEISVPINSESSAAYEQYQKKTGLGIPLTKYIHHPQYDLFVGIPYNTSLDEIALTIKDLDDVLELKYDSMGVFAVYSVDDLLIHTIAMRAEHNLIWLLAVTPNAGVADSLLSRSQLSSRLQFN